MDGDELIASVAHKIEREKALITAASNMRQSTDNPLVQQRVDANIRDGRKNIAYLEEKMRELQIRHMQQDGGSPSQRHTARAARPPHQRITPDTLAKANMAMAAATPRVALARCHPALHSQTPDLSPRSLRPGPITQS